MQLWPQLRARDRRAEVRHSRLQELNEWRNAIAHDDFREFELGETLPLATVTAFRSACRGLAATMDREVAAHVATIVGRAPW